MDIDDNDPCKANGKYWVSANLMQIHKPLPVATLTDFAKIQRVMIGCKISWFNWMIERLVSIYRILGIIAENRNLKINWIWQKDIPQTNDAMQLKIMLQIIRQAQSLILKAMGNFDYYPILSPNNTVEDHYDNVAYIMGVLGYKQ